MENMSGTNKDITYNNHNSEQHQQHGSEPADRFDGSGASVTPISVGSRLVRYRECLKNHAANIGGNVTDGCCEFMPSANDGTLEAFKCAACNCHRNFHRREPPTGHFLHLPPTTLSAAASPSFNHHHLHHHQPNWASSINVPAPGSTYPAALNASPLKIAVGGSGGATDSSSEELHFTMGSGMGKKRFRSKFTQEQKEKMQEFAEKVGWRIPREDDPEVQRFCQVVGVKRKVLKVWMHNNKAAVVSGKKLQQQHMHVQDSSNQ
ncbi:hypothetical protein QVD17_10499 [Tagetes erecta]|uniref:ZF-HD dimerization-type domain-containing protein n=1 Tax=Tagetes erecta TaxID=13708 RepID=A0AAD8L827_TARER|nr:hypothetical protein QVD17_10499 [Tagetes erecta]